MSLSLSFGGKRVDTVKPSGLGACVRDKVPVCCRLSTQMRPRRGKGANRRGSQSIDRVRYGTCANHHLAARMQQSRGREICTLVRGRGDWGGGRSAFLGASASRVGRLAAGALLAWPRPGASNCMTGQGHFGLAPLPVGCPGGGAMGAHNATVR